MTTVGLREKAYNLCRMYLSGSWKQINQDDMVFKAVSGGLSNELFLCSLPSTHTPLNGEPSQVLMRMYGQMHTTGDQEPAATKITESVIFMMLSERKLGPKLYGIFPEGRLEEYIAARALMCRELADPIISCIIARKLANVHCLDVPINKEPTWLFDNMYDWLATFRHLEPHELREEQQKVRFNASAARILLRFPFEKEIEWLRKFLKTAKSPVVFSHNDMQEGNILIPEHLSADKWSRKLAQNAVSSSTGVTNENDEDIALKTRRHYQKQLDEQMVLIDFEYCAYNYRAFDLANHFVEWALDYSSENFPFYEYRPDGYPDEQQRRTFISEYLKHYLREHPEERDLPQHTVQHVLKEVNYFTLATHLFWAIWSVKNAISSQIEFGYWEYGQTRLNAYLEHKQKLLSFV